MQIIGTIAKYNDKEADEQLKMISEAISNDLANLVSLIQRADYIKNIEINGDKAIVYNNFDQNLITITLEGEDEE